jgi:hypothetical protein
MAMAIQKNISSATRIDWFFLDRNGGAMPDFVAAVPSVAASPESLFNFSGGQRPPPQRKFALPKRSKSV